ncbi:hypothetical protein V7O67_07430 [Methanolobus sp. ZRKC4]|uniref:hypothetical protein n=2 Tax=unclassified Methanolobus TaxID=2629569 RepID=UPI0032436CED
MTGQNPSGTSKQEIADLIRIADEMLEILEYKIATNNHEYQKNRNTFIAEYTKWYTRCLPIIRSILPDKAPRYESLYHTNKRSGTNEYTYTIQDYIQGVYFKDKPKSYTDNITCKRLKEQRSILKTAPPRINDFSFEIEKFVKINPIYGQTSSSISKHERFMDIRFSDDHYNSIKAEINSCYKRGFFVATFLLSKELIRNLLIDIIKINFHPISDEQISLYYDFQNNTHKEMWQLLGTLIEKKEEIDINSEAIENLIEMLEAMDQKMRPGSHSFKSISTREDIDNYRLDELVELLNDIVEFMSK